MCKLNEGNLLRLRREIVEHGGFVKNVKTGEYDLLFVTEIGHFLAKERAIEKASERNFNNKETIYDINDCLVRERKVGYVYGAWK